MNAEAATAYRVKDTVDIFAFASKIRQKTRKDLEELGRNLYSNLMQKNPSMTPFDCMQWVSDKIEKKPLSEIFTSISVEIVIRHHEGYYYLIPFSQFLGITNLLDFLAKIDDIEDFSYSPSSVRPKDVTEDQWVERRKVWEEIYLDWDNNYLTIEICDYSMWFNRIDPWLDMMKETLNGMSIEQRKKYLEGFSKK